MNLAEVVHITIHNVQYTTSLSPIAFTGVVYFYIRGQQTYVDEIGNETWVIGLVTIIMGHGWALLTVILSNHPYTLFKLQKGPTHMGVPHPYPHTFRYLTFQATFLCGQFFRKIFRKTFLFRRTQAQAGLSINLIWLCDILCMCVHIIINQLALFLEKFV